jgi:4-hydroxy-tetrahydrodipicolinate synthase
VAWTEDHQLDLDAYRQDVKNCCLAGVPGVYTGGTTGEFYAMDWEEFCQVARGTVETCQQHDVPVMIGCTSTYTRGAARRAEFAAEIGADAIQVALPFWMELHHDEVVPFFTEVGQAAGELALSVYETTRAKLALTLEQHQAIKQAVPRYVMVKSNAGTLGCTAEGCQALSQFANVFVGESLWAELGPHGAQGCCSSMVYWNPQVTLGFWEQVAAGNWDEVNRIHQQVMPLFEFLDSEYSGRGFTDTAYDRMGGLASGFLSTSLNNRGPYRSPTAEDVALLRGWFEQHFPEMIVR